MSAPKPVDEPRFRAGQLLCHATNRAGNPCGSIAMRGQRVCRLHGGAAPAAKDRARLRLAALVNPAIATLGREMMNQANESADKQRAANSLLDRAGWGRTATIEVQDTRDRLLQMLMDLRDEENEL